MGNGERFGPWTWHDEKVNPISYRLKNLPLRVKLKEAGAFNSNLNNEINTLRKIILCQDLIIRRVSEHTGNPVSEQDKKLVFPEYPKLVYQQLSKLENAEKLTGKEEFVE